MKFNILISLFLLLFTCQAIAQSISIGNAFNRYETQVSKNVGEFYSISPVNIPFKNNHSEIVYDSCIVGETVFLGLELTNEGRKKRSFSIDARLDRGEEVVLYSSAVVQEWYSAKNKNIETYNLYEDLLYPINSKCNSTSINVPPGESVKIYAEFKSNHSGKRRLCLNLQWKTIKKKWHYSFDALDIERPKQLNSILFNANNTQSGRQFVKLGREHGMTHLQVNYFPKVYFDLKGNPVGGIDSKHPYSKGFRDTAYPWIKSGGKIILLWEPRHGKLLETSNGTFLKPFTTEWVNGYIALLNLTHKEILRVYPKNKFKLTLYLSDEFSKGGKFNRNLISYVELAKSIKQNLPFIDLHVSYGFKTSREEASKLEQVVDHISLHHTSPKTTSQQKIHSVVKQKTIADRTISRKSHWVYQIGRGKLSSPKVHIEYPLQAVANGASGFSWYAFVNSSGSAYLPADGTSLDYSLIYLKDKTNPLYKEISKNCEIGLLSSLRLKALREGLFLGSLLQDIIENKNKLTQAQSNRFHSLLFKLTQNGSGEVEIDHNQLANYSSEIRRLYSTLYSS